MDKPRDDLPTRLRRWAISNEATPESDLMDEAAVALAHLALTNAEREALEYVELLLRCDYHPVWERHRTALRGLLARHQ